MNVNRTAVYSLTMFAAIAGLAACGGGAKLGHGPSTSYPTSDAPGDAAPARSEAAGQSIELEAAPAPPPPTSMSDDGGAKSSPKESRARRSDDPFALDRERNRPGLATSFGERRHSRVTTAPFARADRLTPFAVGKLFYNDPQGIQLMSDRFGSSNRTSRFAIGTGHVDVGLRDGSGRFLSGFTANGNDYVAGIKGRRYTIVVKNNSPGRVEAVVSVDGLDVIDGKGATFSKRGYLIDAFDDLEIDGFRTSTTEVAAFRFGSVGQSYAQKKHGDTRNVGVIGVALFHERGDSPRRWPSPRRDDSRNRLGADPFPQQFATPPN